MALKNAIVAVLLVSAVVNAAGIQTQWASWGGDLNNTRLSDHCVNTAALKTGMTVKWAFTTDSTISSTPTTCGPFVYAMDFAGNMYKFLRNPAAGQSPLVRKANIKDLLTTTGIRAAFTFSPNCVFMYTVTRGSAKGVHFVAIRTSDLKLAFAPKIIDTHPLATCTMSPTLYGGVLYVGMSSTTESASGKPTFRGNMMAVRVSDGKVLWKTYTAPVGYTGNPVWGSSPVVDLLRKQVCIGTGNNYDIPANVLGCVNARKGNPALQLRCTSKQNYVDALVCFHMGNGTIKWGTPLHGVNVFLRGNGIDYDFAQAPILVNNFLIAASKAGSPFALSAQTGALKWRNVVRVNNRIVSGGASMFGSCSNKKLFIMGLFFFKLTGVSKKAIVAAFDVENGRQVWSRDFGPGTGGVYGPITCTHTVAFVPFFNAAGTLMALNIANGATLGQTTTGATQFSGPAIVQGTMFLGNGYPFNGGTAGNKFLAINLPLKAQPVPGRC